MAITGGFGVMVDTQRGTTRSWYMNRDGVKRWADNDAPCDALPEESLTGGLDDYCECMKCGFIGLFQAGTETCHKCGQYGALVDRVPPNPKLTGGAAVRIERLVRRRRLK